MSLRCSNESHDFPHKHMMPTLFLTLVLQSFLPLFDVGPNDYAGLFFVNSTDSVAVVEVSATDGDTDAVTRGQLTLTGGEQRALLLEEILEGSQRPDSGWICLDSGTSAVNVVLAHGDPDRLTSRSLYHRPPRSCFPIYVSTLVSENFGTQTRS
jgi:hypothetical protein